MKKKLGLGFAILGLGLAAALLFSVAQAQGPAVEKKIFNLTDRPAASPFSPAILVKGTLYISGQLGMDPETGQLQGPTMAEQAERAIKNVEILARKAGLRLSNVVQATVYITDFNEFAEFNEVFRKYFPIDPPTRATVQVAKLARDAKIEISSVAVE
jgi:2-iminobutanoate/2-iminopropanoate deaminase